MRARFEIFPGVGAAVGCTNDEFVILFICFVLTVDYRNRDYYF